MAADAFIIIIACPQLHGLLRMLASFHQTWNRILPNLLQLFDRRIDRRLAVDLDVSALAALTVPMRCMRHALLRRSIASQLIRLVRL